MSCWVKFAILVFTVGSTMADRVPVMLWSNDESVTFPAVLAGHTIGSARFEKDYVEPNIGVKKNLIVFVQNKLSIADISHYADIYGFEDEKDSTFPNVKTLMTGEASTHLPNVLSPVSIFEGGRRGVRVLEAPYNLESWLNVDSDEAPLGLILVHLPDVDTNNLQSSLRNNDEIIGDVVKQLEDHAIKYTALYTAVSSTKKPSTARLEMRSGRQLLQAADGAAAGQSASNASNHWNIGDQVLMYLGGLNMSNSSTSPSGSWTPLDLTLLHVVEAESSCDENSTEISGDKNSTCYITLNYTHDEPIKNLRIKLYFNKSSSLDAGYWMITDLEIYYFNQTENKEDGPVEMNVAPIGDWSPMKYSFSCNEPDVIGPKNGTQSSIYFKLKQFQVQAFGQLNRGGFGYYNDCEPFFTIGIWMALISMSVMLAVLVFGIYMLSGITTMDRFDDPKGKQLIIANAAE